MAPRGSSRASLASVLALAILSSAVAPAQRTDTVRLRLVGSGSAAKAWPGSFERLEETLAAAAVSGSLELALPFAPKDGFELVVPSARVSLDPERRSFSVAGAYSRAGASIELELAGVLGGAGDPDRFLLVVRPSKLPLGAWFGALRDGPLGLLELESSVLAFSDAPWTSLETLGRAVPPSLPSNGAVPRGWSVRGELPARFLTPAVRGALGLGDDARIILSGALDAELSLMTGESQLRSLDASFVLPPPERSPHWPRWLELANSGERSLRLGFRAPSKCELVAAREIEVAGRRLRLELDATSRDASASAEIQARIAGEWPAPLGIEWLALRDSTLRVDPAGDSGTVAGRCELAGKPVTVTLELSASKPPRLQARVDRIGLDELIGAGVAPKLPDAMRAPLEALLGHEGLVLAPAAITLELGEPRIVSIGATVNLRGSSSELLYVREFPGLPAGAEREGERPSRPAEHESHGTFFAFRPTGLTLGKLLPRWSSVPALSDLANVELGLPALCSGTGRVRCELPSGWLESLTWPRTGTGPDSLPPDEQDSTAGKGSTFQIGSLTLPEGWRLRGSLPRASFPNGGRFGKTLAKLEQLLGVELGGLDLNVSLGSPLETSRVDLKWPSGTLGRGSIAWLAGGDLALVVDGGGSVALRGQLVARLDGQAVPFDVDSKLDLGREAIEVSARSRSSWKEPRGIEGLELRDLALVLSADGSGTRASCSASMPLGRRTLQVAIDLAAPKSGAATGAASAALTARLGEATLADLVALAGADASILRSNGFDDALGLEDVELSFLAGRTQRVVASGRARLFDRSVDALLCLERGGGGPPQLAFVARLPDLDLAQLVPELRGTPAALKLPAGNLSFGSGWSEGAYTIPAVAGSVAEELRSAIRPGLRLAGELPLSGLSPDVRRALGLESADASIVLEGEVRVASLGKQARIEKLELRAILPRVSGAAASNLPPWMRPLPGGERTLDLSYAAPDRISLRSTREVEVELAGERRAFRLAAQAQSGPSSRGAAFEASLRAPWERPFGLAGLTLTEASLRGELSDSASLALEGAFTAAGTSGSLRAELRPSAGGRDVEGRVELAIAALDLAGLAKALEIEGLPSDALRALDPSATALEDVKVAVTLGARRALEIGARARVGGAAARIDFAFEAGAGSGRPQPWVVVEPSELTLAGLVPRLASNDVLAELASLRLDGLLVLAPGGSGAIEQDRVPPLVRSRLESRGSGARLPRLSGGLNLLAPLDPSRLPPAGLLAQTLERVGSTLGVDLRDLALRGTLGRAPSDLALSIDLPPIEPRRAPPWLKSGDLSLSITGKPSFSLDGRLQVAVDGEELAFLLSASVRRAGAAPEIKLRGGLESERPWVSPFGLDGLVLERVGLGLAIDAAANVAPSFNGTLKVGRKDLEVAAMVRINASGVPVGGMFRGASNEGFALADLAELQRAIASAARGAKGSQGVAVPLDALPDVALRRFELKLAPRDFPDENVTRGVTLRGDLYVPAKPRGAATRLLASIDGAIDDRGVHAEGSVASLRLGPLALDGVRVSVVAERGDQHLVLDGSGTIGGREQALALLVGREKLSCDAEIDLAGRWRQSVHLAAAYDLERPDFQAAGELAQQAITDLGGELRARAGRRLQDLEAALASTQELVERMDERRAERQRRREELQKALQRKIEDVRARLTAALTDMERAKALCETARRAYVETPDNRPVLKEARKKAWETAQAVYEIGSNSKKAIHAARKGELDSLLAPDAAPELAKAAADLSEIVGALEGAREKLERLRASATLVREFRAKHPGEPLIVLERASLGASLATLAKRGDVPLEAEVRWLGAKRAMKVTLKQGEPLALAREILDALFPEAS